MISTRATSRVRPLRRFLIVSLAIGAVVAGLLAIHLAIDSAAGAPAGNIDSAERFLPIGNALTGDSLAEVSEQGTTTGLLSLDCDHSRALGCAVTALACVLLVILIGMIFLARSPAFFRRLADGRRVAVLPISETTNHVYLPSLAVLSISRT